MYFKLMSISVLRIQLSERPLDSRQHGKLDSKIKRYTCAGVPL